MHVIMRMNKCKWSLYPRDNQLEPLEEDMEGNLLVEMSGADGDDSQVTQNNVPEPEEQVVEDRQEVENRVPELEEHAGKNRQVLIENKVSELEEQAEEHRQLMIEGKVLEVLMLGKDKLMMDSALDSEGM